MFHAPARDSFHAKIIFLWQFHILLTLASIVRFKQTLKQNSGIVPLNLLPQIPVRINASSSRSRKSVLTEAPNADSSYFGYGQPQLLAFGDFLANIRPLMKTIFFDRQVACDMVHSSSLFLYCIRIIEINKKFVLHVSRPRA